MSTSMVMAPHPVSGAVSLLSAAVDGLAGAGLWQVSDQGLADALVDLEAVVRRAECERLWLVAEFVARDVAGRVAGLSTQAFLRSRLRLSPAEASRRVHAARELVASVSPSGEPVAPELPATAERVVSGAISAEHAQVVSAAVRRLPAGLGPGRRSEAERFLAGQAVLLDPAQLRLVARRLHVTLDPDGTLDDDKPARRELSFRRDVDGMDVITGRLDPEGSATVQAALAGIAQPRPAVDGIRDPRSGAQRLGDALVTMADTALQQGGLPVVGGEKPHVSITISLDDLRAQTGHATLHTGVAIPPEAARRIACDATIIPAILGGAGEPLDIGRASRSIPPAIRRAVTLRDIGCIHPGCTTRATHCDIHHVRHWANGGPTTLHNLVLLCPRHHWTTHHEHWRIEFLNGIPHVIPPPIIDPHQRPQRNTMHDLPDG